MGGDWSRRDTWIAKNGSLVYYSLEESRNLVYWTPEDLGDAVVAEVGTKESPRPFSFKVHPVASDGVEFAPSVFAADSDEERKAWIAQIREVQRNKEREALNRTTSR